MSSPTTIPGKIKVWRLKKGSDRRFRAGHPWVYSNELQESPKGIAAGAPIELQDAGGKFLAWGYGNAASLIAFRVLSRESGNQEFDSVQSLTARLAEAWEHRERLGLTKGSFRWVYGENDGLPGCVIDRYVLAQTQKSVIVIQAHTAGIDVRLPVLMQAMEEVLAERGEKEHAVVIRNDLAVRKLEGIEVEEPKVALNPSNWKLDQTQVLIRGAEGELVPFTVDLVHGQKTGFFIDQSENIRQVAMLLKNSKLPKKVRILDLCCYVGQWSTKLAYFLKSQGIQCEVTLVDASAHALALAKKNVEAAGAHVTVVEGDVLKDLERLPHSSFDLVVCDPPALIKGRKDIPQGTHAYLKLNTEAMRLAAEGAWYIGCSCSQLLEETEFMHVLSKASVRNQAQVRWIARGTQAMDHPVSLEFTEGKYLKMWVGLVKKA